MDIFRVTIPIRSPSSISKFGFPVSIAGIASIILTRTGILPGDSAFRRFSRQTVCGQGANLLPGPSR